MSQIKCKECGRAIQAETIREWNQIPAEGKASSDHRSLRKRLCMRCFNNLKTDKEDPEEDA